MLQRGVNSRSKEDNLSGLTLSKCVEKVISAIDLSSVTHTQKISLSFLSQFVTHRQNPPFSLSDSFIGCFIGKKVTNKRTVTLLI